jgi:hypothetical protein
MRAVAGNATGVAAVRKLRECEGEILHYLEVA